jgi:hypothetical protein
LDELLGLTSLEVRDRGRLYPNPIFLTRTDRHAVE